jgi:GxxExxY protein
LELRGIPYRTQYPVAIKYKNRDIGKGRLDFFVNNTLVVELKAVEKLTPKHKAQVISYLKMTTQPLGLLINFNETLLKDGIQRIIYTP